MWFFFSNLVHRFCAILCVRWHWSVVHSGKPVSWKGSLLSEHPWLDQAGLPFLPEYQFTGTPRSSPQKQGTELSLGAEASCWLIGGSSSSSVEVQHRPFTQFCSQRGVPMSLASSSLWKPYTHQSVYCFICWKSYMLEMQRCREDVRGKRCYSPAQAAHRLSDTWPAGTVPWLAHILASGLTVEYSCWLLPSFVEICFERKGKALIWEVSSVLPFPFSPLPHGPTFFK